MLDKVNTAPVIKGLYINGQWQSGSGSFNDINPSDGSVWAEIPDAGVAETRAAVAAAQQAFAEWSARPFQQRAQLLLKAADIWEQRRDDYVAAAQHEGGGWFGKGMFEAG